MATLRRAPAALSGVILAGGLAALLLLPSLDRDLRDRLSGALQGLQASVERETGLRLTFESMSPSILKAFSLRRIELKDAEGRTVLAAERVYAYYDFGALLLGKGQLAISELSFARVRADLRRADLERLSALASRFGGGGGGGGSKGLPSFAVSGKSLDLRLSGFAPGELRAEIDSFRIGKGGPDAQLLLSGRLSARVDPALAPGIGRLEVPVGVDGLVARDFSRARLMLSLKASSDSFALERQRFELSYAQGVAELRKVEDEAPLDAFVRYDLRGRALAASLRMEGYAPARMATLRGGLSSLSPWLRIPLSGSLSFEALAGDPKRTRYSLELSGELADSSLGSLARAAVSAKGGPEGADIAYARVEGGLGRASYSGSLGFRGLSLDGELALEASLAEGRLPLEADLRVLGGQGHYAAYSDSVRAAGVAFRDFALDASIGSGGAGSLDFGLSFRPPEAEAPPILALPPDEAAPAFSGEAVAASGGSPRFRCEGSLSGGPEPVLELSLGLESFDLAAVEPLAAALVSSGAAALLSDLRLDGEVFALSDLKRLSFSTTDFALVSRSSPGAYALVSVSGSEKGVSLRKASVSYGGYRAEASGSADFAEAGRLGFEAKLSLEDVPYSVKGTYAGEGLFLSGDYGLEVKLRGMGGETYLEARADGLPIPLKCATLVVGLDADGRYAGPADWSLLLSSLSAELAGSAGAGLPRLGLSGTLGPGGGDFPSISLSDEESSLSGSGRLDYDLSRSSRSASFKGGLSGKGGERYDLAASLSGDSLEARLEVASSPVSRFVKGPLSGRVDGKARVSGSLERPLLSFEASLRDGTLAEDPLELVLSGSFGDGLLRVGKARAAWRGMELSQVELSLEAASLASELSGSFRSLGAAEPLSFSFSASGSRPDSGSGAVAAAAAGEPAGPDAGAAPGSATVVPSAEAAGAPAESATAVAAAGGYRVQGRLKDWKYRGLQSRDWPFLLVSRPEALSFSGGDGGELSFERRADGRFQAKAGAPLPFAFAASGRSAGGKLEAEVTGLGVDLSPFLGLLGPLPVGLEGGRLEGSLSVGGSLADPEFSGSLNLDGIAVTVPDIIAGKIGPMTLPVLVDGKRLSLSVPSLPIGTARASLRAEALLDGWRIGEISASLRNLPGAPLPLDVKILGVLVAGSAYADLDFSYSGDVARLGGKVSVERSRVVINPGLFKAEGSRRKPQTFFDLDLDIGFGTGVQVLFPSEDLPIVSGYAEPSSRLALKLFGEAQEVSLKGTAFLRGGDVFYIQRNFFLKSAKIVFNETSGHFDPLVTLYAERRERNDRGPILVMLRAENAPASNFKPQLSSSPSLSEEEIAALLGEGLLGVSESGEVDIRKAVIASSEFIPQLNATKAFESRVRQALGLDIFSLRSQVVQRWLLDISSLDRGTEPTGLGSYLDETSLFAGKYLDERTFLYASLSLREEDPLVPSGPLLLDSEVGVEFDTPFGTLLWSVTPTSKSLENLYISDQSLSLSWRLPL